MIRPALHRYFLPVIVAGVTLFNGVAFADGSISGPVAGYVTDSSRAQLRTIFGVPGAFTFGNPLALPEGVAQVRLAPGQDFALVERANASPALLFLKAGVVDHLAAIDGAMASADWVAFSPGAGSALLFSAASNRLQVLSGLPDAPQVSLDWDAAALSAQPLLGGVSDDGSLVLVASGTSVYRIARDGSSQVVFSAGGIQSLTVLRNGVDAAVADPTTGSVNLVRNAASTPAVRVLASGLDGIGAIFPASDGLSLFVAQPGAATVSSIDLASGGIRSFPASVAPVGLIPLRNRDTFLISAEANHPGWVFYRDGLDARSVFIPAADSAREIPVRGGVR
jgi:hypothetical protein